MHRKYYPASNNCKLQQPDQQDIGEEDKQGAEE